MEKRVRMEGIKKDRISKLPEHLRHQILSNLPTKEAAATTLLSSSWKDLWLTLPCLHLGQEFFSKTVLKHPKISIFHEMLLMFVDKIFKRRLKCADHRHMLKELKLYIPRLHLSSKFKIPESTAFVLNKYLVLAVIEFRVKKLDFSFGYGGDYLDWRHDNLCGVTTSLPLSSTLDSWKRGAELTDLTLRGCMIDSCLETRWFTLRRLSLKHVNFHQQALDSLTANCLSIEALYLVSCSGEFDSLNALCLKRLVTLYIFDEKHYFKKIQIDAPDLEHLEFHGGKSQDGSCEIHDLALSKGLKLLKICGSNARITDEWLNHNVPRLSELDNLTLCGCTSLRRVRISSRSLHTIVLFIPGLEELEIIDAPRLLHLELSLDRPPPTPSFMLNNPSALTKAKVRLRRYNYTNNVLDCENLVKFLGIFKVMRRMEVNFIEKVVIPLDIRKRLSPPLAVKDLKLNYLVDSWKNHDKFNDFIDSLLWLSPRLEEVIIRLDLYKSMVFQFEYKEDDDTLEKCDYCESLPVRCWRHCLAKVTIKNMGVTPSPISYKHDAELEELFKTGTKPKNIVVKITYCATLNGEQFTFPVR